MRGLQWRFLIVFWLYKMADWLQGPYFYEVYASKIINGVAVSSAGVARLFLTGFGSTALFGAVVGGLVDGLGRKKGSLAFALMYSLSALSTKCGTLGWLFAGRVAGGSPLHRRHPGLRLRVQLHQLHEPPLPLRRLSPGAPAAHGGADGGGAVRVTRRAPVRRAAPRHRPGPTANPTAR